MSQMKIGTTLPYAGFGKRFYAYLIDQSIIQGTAFALAYPIGMYKWGDQAQSMEALITFLSEMMPIITLLIVLIGVVYGTFFEASALGATWGKRYCGLRVTNESGEGITYSDAFLRNVGLSVINIAMYFDFIMALLVLPMYLTLLLWKEKQTLYDKVLHIVVIRTK